jgi:CRP-like cAMP-binding protein
MQAIVNIAMSRRSVLVFPRISDGSAITANDELFASLGPASFVFANLQSRPTSRKCAMAKLSQQEEDASVLSKAKHGLVYLTANDWALIADKATRLQFKAGAQLVHQDRRTHGIYVLLKGSASAQISSQGASRKIERGEVCGEISFLDELPATANVVADEAVEAYYLDRPTLQSLFELFPHMGSRFYHSLAGILSRRLREMIGTPSHPAKPAAAEKKESK